MVDYIITELPDEYYDREANGKVMNEEFKKMATKHPKIFTGEKWDKYRDKQEEEIENGSDNKSIG